MIYEKLSRTYRKFFKIGTIVYSLGNFLFNGLQITQDEDGSIIADAGEKLHGINPIPADRYRRKKYERK